MEIAYRKKALAFGLIEGVPEPMLSGFSRHVGE
jgi:hypothetical protein